MKKIPQKKYNLMYLLIIQRNLKKDALIFIFNVKKIYLYYLNHNTLDKLMMIRNYQRYRRICQVH